MKHHQSRTSRQRGFSFGDFLVLIAIIGIGYMIKGQFSAPKLMGSGTGELIEQMGQPIAKSTVPRPR